MKSLAAIGFAWLALAAAGPAWGQLFPPQQLERIRTGLREIYSLEYSRAAENFQSMIRESPDDPAGYVYLASTYWLQELSAQKELTIDRFAASDFFSEAPRYAMRVNSNAEARFRRASDQAIQKARQRLAQDPDDQAALFLLGVAYENLACFEASLKQSWWSAFRFGARTLQYHQRLLKEDPNLYDARLATGVYNYVTASLGWSVKWLAFLMGYHGSKTRGKRDLELVAEKGDLAGDDARVILVLIYTRERNYQKAFDYLAELVKKYPENYLARLDMGGLALRMNEPSAAIALYANLLQRRDVGDRKYADIERATLLNRLGVAYRQQGELRASTGEFHKALAEPNISARAATIAHLELGKTLDLMGRRDEARAQYQAVMTAIDVAGSRHEARELLRHTFRR